MKTMLPVLSLIKKIRVNIFCFTLFFLSGLAGIAQPNFPFTQRNTWDGPYDIKMISAPNLEAVYINSAEALTGAPSSGRLLADSVIDYKTMVMTGDLFEINNRYKDGSSSPTCIFDRYDIPSHIFLCNDPQNGCGTLGLPLNTPNSTCGANRYQNPTYVNKYVSMTYADYDTDLTTYSSSMAELDIPSCSEIEAAYLYWSGNFRTSNPPITLVDGPLNSYSGSGDVFNISTTSGYDQVKFKMPGSSAYVDVNATTSYASTRSYVCVSDVTSLLQGTGGGQFWVANQQSYPIEGDGGSTSGWTLVLVFNSPLSPPRQISLWDGFINISANSTQTFTLSGLQAPSSTNFKSYVGFAALDGENIASQLYPDGDSPEGLGFQTDAGGTLVNINPFQSDQPHYKLWTKKGYPSTCDGDDNLDEDGCKVPQFDGNWCTVYDGISSSHITTYDEVTDKNGNEIVRLPSNRNTLGYDAHHMKLPAGAVAPNATTATLSVRAGPQGSTMPFLAYVAIERLQPKLVMTKFADKTTTGLNTQINYTLRVKNVGNAPSLGGDIIYDTLDVATNYTAGSVSGSKPGVSLVSSAGDNLEINLADPIPAGDSIDVTFSAQVITYADDPVLFNSPSCKRSVQNTAFIDYNTVSSGVLRSKSNANDCGIGSETIVLLVDAMLSTSTATVLGPFNGCSIASDNVISRIQTELLSGGVAPGDISEFDILDESYVKVPAGEVFGIMTSGVSYFAIREHSTGGGCQEVFEVQFFCGCTNTAPVASADTITICMEDGATSDVTVWNNDTDAEGDPIKVTEIISTNGGTAIVLNDSTIQFTPDPGISGVVEVSYELCDDIGPCSGCDTAKVTLCSNVSEIFIPNFITPGKDEYNKFFKVVGILPNTSLKIYNRWGEMVYASDDYQNDWEPGNHGMEVFYYYLVDPVRQKEWRGWIHVINETQ